MRRVSSLALALSMILSLAACGGGDTTATTMRLQRAEGSVAVSDGDGKDVPLLENLGLYSGYGVDTRSKSYAWIDLDDVKLTKMDQDSGIAIQKEGKALEIKVKSGSLFFNVTQPLEDDETMSIRTSTMLVGIRGTCGWVEDWGGLSRVYLLEGVVECSAGEHTVQISAWEMAEVTSDGGFMVSAFAAQDIPDFVRDEVDEDLTAGIPDSSGPDLPEPSFDLMAEVPIAAYWIEHEDSEETYKYMLDSYFERPVFESDEPGYMAINDFFRDLKYKFFLSDNMERIVQQAEPLTPSDTPFDYHYDAEVTAQSGRYVSVHFSTFWFAGDTPEPGNEYYVLSTVTGEQLGIRDFIDAPEEEILDMIGTRLAQLDASNPGILYSTDLSRSPDEYDFYIQDGAVHIHFDPGDIAPNTAGEFDITLPAPLKLN